MKIEKRHRLKIETGVKYNTKEANGRLIKRRTSRSNKKQQVQITFQRQSVEKSLRLNFSNRRRWQRRQQHHH